MRRLNWAALGAMGLLVLASACGTENPSTLGGQNGLANGLPSSCELGQQATCTCNESGLTGMAVCRSNLTFSACSCAAAPVFPMDQMQDPMNMASASGLPCDVATVLEQNCWTCHGTTLAYTAPMRLVTWEDLHAATPSTPAVPVYQTMMARVQHPNSPMPPAPNARLDAAKLGVLQNWINAGHLKGPDTCTDMGTAGVGGDPMMGMDAAVPLPDDVECFDFYANNGGGSAGAPFQVPSTPDYYHCFNFKAPWTGDVQGIRSMSVIDNTASVHHWILYSSSGVNADAKGQQCGGQHSNGQFVVGWAPGANDMEMPDGVGLQIPKTGFQLEIHYNASSAGQTDKSGVKLCVTKQLRPNTAAVHPLGQEWLQPTSGAGDITGTCVPKGPFPITIITSSPHMHKKGTHMKTVIMRANGMTEDLINMPFDFNTQIAYPTPKTINQGDKLITTCTYNSGVTYGTKTTQEMCYDFVTAYPAGALSGGGGISNNGNTCIQLGF